MKVAKSLAFKSKKGKDVERKKLIHHISLLRDSFFLHVCSLFANEEAHLFQRGKRI